MGLDGGGDDGCARTAGCAIPVSEEILEIETIRYVGKRGCCNYNGRWWWFGQFARPEKILQLLRLWLFFCLPFRNLIFCPQRTGFFISVQNFVSRRHSRFLSSQVMPRLLKANLCPFRFHSSRMRKRQALSIAFFPEKLRSRFDRQICLRKIKLKSGPTHRGNFIIHSPPLGNRQNIRATAEGVPKAPGIRSPSSTGRSFDRLLCISFRHRILGFRNRGLDENVGDVLALPGSVIQWRIVASKALQHASLVFKDTNELTLLQISRGGVCRTDDSSQTR